MNGNEKKAKASKDNPATRAVLDSIHNPKPPVPGVPRPDSSPTSGPASEKGVTLVRHEIRFKELAVEIVNATMEVGKKYLNLCSYIRREKVTPKETTQWLLDLGFAKTRASEINRVAQASDEVFSKLEARALGWKGALDLARGKDELKQALIDDKESLGVVIEVESQAIADEESSSEDKKPSAAALLKEYRAALDRHAIAMLKLVASRKGKGVRAEKWDLGSGWKLVLVPGEKGKQDVTPAVPVAAE